ncbi:MAG TPA: amino acid adenylation domain-containing protein [Longimicrobiaceae bacterium]|nr:amino acid adenylation domain-containing protein [Longimicrobiaceae bacterium]
MVGRVARYRVSPPSFAQERLWLVQQIDGASAPYHVFRAFRIRGVLDPGVLEQAFGEVVRRHETLRTTFREVDGQPVQVIAEFAGFAIPVEACSTPGEAEREALLRRYAAAEAERPFDLSSGPLFRVGLVRLQPEEHVLLLCMHHIVSDAWSLGLLYREVSALYAAFREGGASPLPELRVQYSDYARWSRRRLQSGALDRQLSYWRERLAGAPALLDLPVDHPRPAVQSYRGARTRFVISRELLGRLEELGRSERATLYMVLLAAFQVLLSRYSRSEDVVVGTSIAGRTRQEVEALVGFFANTLALRTDLSGDPGFRELLRRVRTVTLDAYEHQEVPFEKLVEDLQPERSLAYNPIFQAFFALQNAPGEELRLHGLGVEAMEIERTTAKFDLSLLLSPIDGGLEGILEYSTALFEPATVSRMATHLAVLLEAAAADPGRPISLLPIVRAAEREMLVREWSGAGAGHPATGTLHEGFERRARACPDTVAVTCEGDSLDYGELNARANRLARRLRALGVGPEARVGLCAERSTGLVVGVLAVLKAGGAYVPLDPAYPPERLAYMARDSGIRVLVVQSALRDRVPCEGVEVVVLEDVPADAPAEDLCVATSPENLAYVIYTSGSTGRPKGVGVTHGNVLRLFECTQGAFGFGETDVWTLFHSYAFDFSVWEIWGALLYGGRLVVVPWAVSRDPATFHALLAAERVTVLSQTPTAFRALADADEAEVEPLSRLRLVVFGGEALSYESLRGWLDRYGPRRPRLVNMYGITETTVHVTWHTVTGAELRRAAVGSGIGVPIPDLRAYVLDPAGNPAPVGVPGELHVGGAGVARGYLGRPELTAERFVPDPFSGEAGARLYRSGDLARWRGDGTLEYLGRIDQQVKVRGFRIEPAEIESALLAHPGVAAAVVVVRGEAGGAALVAYLVPAGDAPSPSALRDALRRQLPEHMVPAAFVVIDRIPRTANGKVDRRALPAPEAADAGTGCAPAAPRTPVEEVLAGIWAEVLRLDRVGVDESFFAIGGHSLRATQVVARIREVFGVGVPLRSLFEGATVAELAAQVEALRRAGLPDLPPVLPVERTPPPPLSFAQERLWFLDRLQPGSVAYHSPVVLRLYGALDERALERALGEIVRRHEALRTTFEERGEAPVQVIAPFGGFTLPVEMVAGMDRGECEAEARRRADQYVRAPFDLTAGPLFRAALLRLGPEEHLLVLVLHHIVTDGWSTDVLFRELSALYGAYREGRESPLAELGVQYADYAAWQREQLRGELPARQLAYWRERLAGAPELLELPTDYPRPAARTDHGAGVAVSLPGELLEALRALGRGEGATLYMVLLGAVELLLARYAGSDDVVVGGAVAGRTRREVEGLIGFFANTLVLRTDLGGDPSFREVLRRVREVTLGAYEHQDLPFERLVAELQPERSLSLSPLFQVMFTLRERPGSRAELTGLRVEEVAVEPAAAKFDLSLAFGVDDRDFRAEAVFSTDLFEHGTVVRMLAHLEHVLEQVARDAEVHASELELLGGAERRQVVEGWSRTAAEHPEEACVHHLFEAQVERTPDAVALVHRGERLTYARLNERANRLAHHLRRRGVGPDARVAICVERSPEMVVGLLAILKAGGAYVPLDPAYPPERLHSMLEDSTPAAVLTQPSLAHLFEGTGASLVDIATGAAAWAGQPETDPERAGLTPEHLCYVIYTSGSTGQPKGTEVPHRAIPGFFRGADYVCFDEHQVLLQHSSTSWDALTLELWPALLSGGTCVLYPGQTSEPATLGEQVRAHGVSTLWLSSAYFNSIVDTAPQILEGVRQVMVGGEALSVLQVRRALELYPQMRLVNGYGPSECTVFTTCWPVPAEFEGEEVPIGRPIGDRRVYVLDRWMNPVPAGVRGELYVGGPAVARGYLNRPALTAERFVPDPFSGRAGARLYRSGDRVRWRADGVLEFVGRVDFQVKVRGFRVEPGEIEAQLTAHPHVREAVVIAREDTPGGARLVGYVCPEGGTSLTASELRGWLGERLPEYMVPSAIVLLDALPLTAHGKVDRRALPAPEHASAREPRGAPGTPAEEVLAEVWAELLRVERVGTRESFFHLGGHSLLAMRLVSRVREVFGVELPLRALFEAPTVAGMAERVERLRHAAEPLLPRVVPVGRTGPLPLSFAQERLWFLDRLEPGSALYNVPAALWLRGPLDAPALERALGEVVRRHEALRTTFEQVVGVPAQVIAPFAGFTLPVEDLSALDQAVREAAVRQRVAEVAARPFDLAAGPLFRARLLRLGGDAHALLLCMHHIVSDGWSLGVLFREMSALYEAYREGRESPLAPPPVQYADFAIWQREQLRGAALEQPLAWWRERLAGAPALLELPTDRPRPAVPTHRGASASFLLPSRLLERLQALGRGEGATLFMVLLAAWQVLLARCGGGPDVVVGSPIAGRTRGETEGVIGFFVNTLVLRTDLGGDPDFREVLRRVREATLGAYEHQEVPFERLVTELQPERSLGHTPLFQVLFALEDAGGARPILEGLRCEGVEADPGLTKFDLSLAMAVDATGLQGRLGYATDLFDAATIERMAVHLARVLEQVADDAAVRLSGLELMDADERARVLDEWNRTDAPYPADRCIHHLVEEQAARTPDAVAVLWEHDSLTYGELNRRANRLAHHLRGLGVGPETRVGVCLERTPELVVALLAVLKAGGAYVPLDPSYPAERLEVTLDDAGARVLVTQESLRGLLPGQSGVALVVLESDRAAVDAGGAENPAGGAVPRNLAYLIYTSGSTGRPKGVAIEHQSVVAMLSWAAGVYPADVLSGVLASTSTCFDLSVYELFLPLSTGGRVILVENALALPRAPAADEVRLLNTVPSAGAALLSTGGIPTGVRTVNLAGEPLPAELVDAMYARGVERVYDLYGPSEDTTYSTYALRRPGGPVTVGRAISNTRAWVLDESLRPVPIGVPGELYLGGRGVTRGYLGQPGLTAERYVPDHLGAEPGARLYRTGDRVRWRPDGPLECLGRLDQQVKVRGLRVEPGEVEAVLRRHPAVRECAAVAREHPSGDRRLVAYVVGDADAEALRSHLRQSLPEYMVPGVFMMLDALPRLPNGKLDRRALPAPATAEPGRRLEPGTELEARIAALWGELLGVEAVGVEDNFFDLGGHSLLIVRLQAMLASELGHEVTVAELFQYPTVRSLAGRLKGHAETDAADAGEHRAGARHAALDRRLEARRRRGR